MSQEERLEEERSQKRQGNSHYAILNVPYWATAQQIRQAYREMSKHYHPDTTHLPEPIAIAKFQELNEAYATLSNPERRLSYDLKIGYSRLSVMQAPADLNRSVGDSYRMRSRSTYLDPTDRPLSAGEIFALFILGLTFVGCLLLVIAIGMTRGDMVVQTLVDLNPHPLAHTYSRENTTHTLLTELFSNQDASVELRDSALPTDSGRLEQKGRYLLPVSLPDVLNSDNDPRS